MLKPEHIHIADYDYRLPEDRIARYPLPSRDQSSLLHYEHQTLRHQAFSSLPDLLKPGDLLVFNETRVIQARLLFQKESGSNIEIFCLEPVEPAEYQLAFRQTNACRWRCLVGNARKWKQDDLVKEVLSGPDKASLTARKVNREGYTYIIDFSWDNNNLSFAEIIENSGLTPIPPYLKRDSVPEDRTRYQTVYSRYEGSVAAPTAGLHFTGKVLKQLDEKGIHRANLTLHVGAGTFTPVKEENAVQHLMHGETVVVDRKLIRLLRDHPGRIISVGTTGMRSIESLYWLGFAASRSRLDPSRIEVSQWEAYASESTLGKTESLDQLIAFMDHHNMAQLQFRTMLMIVPGYRFKMTDGLITNFHQPRSTLLLLVAAFIGKKWKDVYDYAMQNDFRFLSYGDVSLLFP
ncbi:MAG: S-adenosylmethionine:tRNA ribosyltransferase-isomerase [Bacteroidales bacterium]|nr:S-adenosylmethionine:tRNA ribosyltransferase-isomerase [Bacteroidales bacterium]